MLRHRLLLSLIVLTLLIKIFSLNESWVETLYSRGFYPFISHTLRIIFGWMPFSFGDLFYLAFGIYLFAKLVKFFRLLFSTKLRSTLSWLIFRKYLSLLLAVYLVFNLFWGLNYNRQGIAKQTDLNVRTYSNQDLYSLIKILEDRLILYAPQVDSIKRLRLNKNHELFREGIDDYKKIRSLYPFLDYSFPSIKASLYGTAGKYFGYTGYYNPFTAEAQIKTSIPVFLKPFVLNHEIAHQLGYAKEDEASFVSYLVCKNSDHADTRYSAYYELFFDALYFSRNNVDSLRAIYQSLPLRVRYDKHEEREWLSHNKNFIEPFMSGTYDKYLKLNNQPKGNATYNEVIALLIAFMKRYGAEAV